MGHRKFLCPIETMFIQTIETFLEWESQAQMSNDKLYIVNYVNLSGNMFEMFVLEYFITGKPL